ncbi:MAG: Hsp20/alpha crystallin family protein [Planctomycetota bacterium]
MTNHDSPKGKAAVEGILGGLGDILGKIADLADKAETIQRDGNFQTRDGKDARYQVGFNIRTMADSAGEQQIKVEPFGDVRREPATGEAAVSETREPPTDIFEEDDHVLVVIEMPGISDNDATFDIDGDVLTIEAEHGSKRYRKELLLPTSFTADDASISSNNGVFEIRLSRSDSEAA